MSWLPHTVIQPYQVLTPKRAIVWAIGGSDSSGGAGIQADIQAINGLRDEDALGNQTVAQACTIVTTVTAQNSESVSDLMALPIDLLEQQWLQLLADMPPAVIKISLLANPQQVEWLAEQLANWPAGLPMPLVIYDPVAIASTGDALTAEPILDAVKQQLLRHVDVLTPNATEVLAITGIALLSSHDLQRAFDVFRQHGVKTVLFKGGHTGLLMDVPISDDHVIDAWTNGDCWRYCASPQLTTKHGHGTGCSFASSLASGLAQGYALEDAFAIAHAYVQQGLKAAVGQGKGPGPVAHLGWPKRWQDFPKTANALAELDAERQACAPCELRLGLYPVVPTVEWLERLLKCGVKTIQLRAKDLPEDQAEPLVKQAVLLGQQYQARVFINDYWQLALKHNAYGVHLGQEDVSDADVEKIAGSGVRLGLSTHGYFEMLRAAALQPSYLAIGHIFATTTKDMPSTPQGVLKLSQQASLLASRDTAGVEKMPTVAIGGIDFERAQQLVTTDVGSIAVVRAFTQTSDPELAAEHWLHLVGAGDRLGDSSDAESAPLAKQ
ncbi:bifunctional hydroxymethylpyrimidine kinase/phosphomethylpyrimidine kinase [Neiella marina]|uniref:Bifunctional hydroxymethylpyrimidine kinase/phosphomethylpyrimidine kinase n=1 Tax=Neiella marina TaxID=508461 RepID=A0A8J2U9U3_9GAMM|nr:thiamine phosphate synthase [Neiella marina]GGA88292.1 bifunctional hydroxymethylpyrimidine kinase/phosphomethylpyrimidine kinase [Neiella marina]